jgi:hypothetical protein
LQSGFYYNKSFSKAKILEKQKSTDFNVSISQNIEESVKKQNVSYNNLNDYSIIMDKFQKIGIKSIQIKNSRKRAVSYHNMLLSSQKKLNAF